MSDELMACWAALVAYVEDVHQPQYNLTGHQWQAAERLFEVLNVREGLTGEDLILSHALGSMVEGFDYPDMDEAGWAVAERMLAEYTAKVEAAS